MDLHDKTLVTILAASDAVFIPDRDPTARPRHQVISERRWKFPERASEQFYVTLSGYSARLWVRCPRVRSLRSRPWAALSNPFGVFCDVVRSVARGCALPACPDREPVGGEESGESSGENGGRKAELGGQVEGRSGKQPR